MTDYIINLYESLDGDLFAIRETIKKDYKAGNQYAMQIVDYVRLDPHALPFTDAAQYVNISYNERYKHVVKHIDISK